MPFPLLATRRFLPLFVTQFLGAFNDNLFKNALLVWIAFAMPEAALAPATLIALAAGVFILPFFLFSATAGELADAHDKAKIARIVKVAETALMTLGLLGFLAGEVAWLMLVLFGMGAHSAFFGPVKYAMLPDHLREDELIQGNALIEAGTFLAILLGTIVGGLLILGEGGSWRVGALAVAVAASGYAASRFIPPARPSAAPAKADWNILRASFETVRAAARHPQVFRVILLISWFWCVGATLLAVLPTYVGDVLHAEAALVTLLLAVFSVGIAAGSIVCHAILKRRISTVLVPWAAIGMAVFTLDFVFATQAWMAHPPAGTIGAQAFLQHAGGLRIGFDLTMLAFMGGLYSVPLYAKMQADAAPGHRARTIAANNIVNALFMVMSAAALALAAHAGLALTTVFSALAVLTALAALFCHKI